MKRFKISTAGESHGEKLVAIIENLPANMPINLELINHALLLRQAKETRGDRQKLENDTVKIVAGFYDGKTTGAPLCLEVKNNDFRNFLFEDNKIPRPGHADYYGSLKYNIFNINVVIERASARKTAIDVAIGNIFVQMLAHFNIEINAEITEIDGEKYLGEADYIEKINEAKIFGDTLGGKIKTTITGLPKTIGSYVSQERKLDGIIAGQIMAINTVKSISFGNKIQAGLLYIDAFESANGKLIEKTNNSGGIVAGMSTGQNITFETALKPIPTMLAGIETINLETMESVETNYIRSDISVLNALTIIIESEAAVAIANELFNSFATLENFDLIQEDKIWQK